MEKLNVELENCYGIHKMHCEIDFSKKNAAVLYAPNGMMKSSFAKTFKAIQDEKEPKELVSGATSKYIIVDEKNKNITSESIMVVNPFDENASNNQGLLMANADLREQYVLIHKNLDEQTDEIFARIKEEFGYGIRSSFNPQDTFCNDFKISKRDLLEELKTLFEDINNIKYDLLLPVEEIKYNDLFNDKVLKFISKGKNPQLLDEYTKKYEELLEKSQYLKKGIIDHNNYSNIANVLDGNGFFKADNRVILQAKDNSQQEIDTKDKLEKLIADEKAQVLNTKELKDLFEKINKELNANKDTVAFGSYIQQHPEIIEEYNNVEMFKKKIWIKVFKKELVDLKKLVENYISAKENLKKLADEAKKQETDWHKAIQLFKERFFVPFIMEPSNQEDVILKNDMPSLRFIFENNCENVPIQKETLLEVLSTGEKRAYYILNFIFEILVREKESKETFLILDDISDSFDYKNKYAIIEYINDIMQLKDSSGNFLFKILLLTHNFDFYRTISSRLAIRKNSFIAYKEENEIKLKSCQYTGNIFAHFKEQVKKDDKFIVASIPFVRNLIEYAFGSDNAEYLILANLLHFKPETENITVKAVEDIFNQYWCKDSNVIFAENKSNTKMWVMIRNEADKISDKETLEIEDKIVVSMAIRLLAEKYMIEEIKENINNGYEIIENIYNGSNQTGMLIKTYKQNFTVLDRTKLKVLEQVAMMTPENIHLNSFMFEPILDMSLHHLVTLYEEIKKF